jgi:hypothetical protein
VEVVTETTSAADRAAPNGRGAAAADDLDAGLNPFLRQPSLGRGLAEWLGPAALRAEVVGRLTQAVARIDALLARQVNAILHHPDFQQLEASWRGLHYLVHQVPDGANV